MLEHEIREFYRQIEHNEIINENIKHIKNKIKIIEEQKISLLEEKISELKSKQRLIEYEKKEFNLTYGKLVLIWFESILLQLFLDIFFNVILGADISFFHPFASNILSRFFISGPVVVVFLELMYNGIVNMGKSENIRFIYPEIRTLKNEISDYENEISDYENDLEHERNTQNDIKVLKLKLIKMIPLKSRSIDEIEKERRVLEQNIGKNKRILNKLKRARLPC